jgi:hypothetical protein
MTLFKEYNCSSLSLQMAGLETPGAASPFGRLGNWLSDHELVSRSACRQYHIKLLHSVSQAVFILVESPNSVVV